MNIDVKLIIKILSNQIQQYVKKIVDQHQVGLFLLYFFPKCNDGSHTK